VFAWKSNSCLKGSALHTPGSGSCDPFSAPLSATATVIRTNFSDPALSDDKEFVAADHFVGGPFQDNVYVTWTIFDFSCPHGSYCQSPIYFSKSSDGGVTWSAATIISGVNADLCQFGNVFKHKLDEHACNFDQGSYPVVGPDGSINVVFNN